MRFGLGLPRFISLTLCCGLVNGCISKDTTVNGRPDMISSRADDDDNAEPEAPIEAGTTDTEPEDVTEPVTETEGTVDDEEASTDDTVTDDSAGTSEPDDEVTQSDDTELPSDDTEDTTEASDDTETDVTDEGDTDEGDTDEPEAEPVACTEGLTPTKGEIVQLTESTTTKSRLSVAKGPDGVLLTWQSGMNEVAYAGFTQALEPLFEETKLAGELRPIAGAPGITFSENRTAFAIAYDQQSVVHLNWIDPTTGEPGDVPIATGMATQGGRIHLIDDDAGNLFISTMSGGSSCPGTGMYIGRFINEDSEAALEPTVGPCVNGILGVFTRSLNTETDFGLVLWAGIAGVQFFDSVDGTTQGGISSDPSVPVGVDSVVGWDGTKLLMVSGDGSGGINYARFLDSGAVAGMPAFIDSMGRPASMALTDEAAGVLLYLNSSVQFFARSLANATAYNPLATVVATPGLVEPQLVAFGSEFVTFFIAEDANSDLQVFGSKIQCKP